jgi:hypothetical protein
MSRADLSLWRIFRIPLLLVALSLTGLIRALLDDGLWDGLGAALLAATLVIATAAWVRRRRSRSH